MTRYIIALLIGVMLFSGCGTFKKDIHVKMNKPIRVQKGVQELAIISPDNGVELNALISEAIATKVKAGGIKVVSMDEADYVLTISVPTEEKLVDEDGNVVELAALSTGVGSFAVSYGVTRDLGDSLGVGAAAAIGGAIVGYVLKDSSVAMQVDLVFTDSNKRTQQTRLFSTVRRMHLSQEDGEIALVENISETVSKLFL